MHHRGLYPRSLRALADLQAGVVTTEQAVGCGLSRHVLRRLVREQTWRTLRQGVHLTAASEPSWDALAWAGVLAGGDRARLAGRAAAWLYGFDAAPPSEIDVLVPVTSGLTATEPWRFVREREGVRSAWSVGGPPRTGVEDTVLDLTDRCDRGDDVVAWVTSVVQRRLSTTARLRRAVVARRRLRHRRLLLDLLNDVAAGAQSPLEVAYLRDVERAHGLPSGRRQAARLNYCTDVSYDDYGLLVELDGRLGHFGMGRFRDMARDNAFVVQGRPTLRYGWADVTQLGCEVAQQVATVLTMHGWQGLAHPCPRCRNVSVRD